MSSAFLQGLFASLGGVEFIWLLVSGLAVLVLAAESAALLTLWRRPSRLWKLGLVSLGAASLMFWVMSLPLIPFRTAGLYVSNTIQSVNVYYFHVQAFCVSVCSTAVPTQRDAPVVVALSLLTIVGLTSACVVWAFKLKAREPRPPLGTVWLALVRLLVAFIGTLVCAFGVAMVVTGVLLIIDYWVNFRLYLANPEDFSGFYYYFGLLGVIDGAIVALVGALVLWLSGLRRRATMSTQST